MAGLGWQELVIVLVIIMIIFGAGKLPQVAKSLGQGVKEFREEAQAPVGADETVTRATSSTTGAAPTGAGTDAERMLRASTDPVGTDGVRAGSASRDVI